MLENLFLYGFISITLAIIFSFLFSKSKQIARNISLTLTIIGTGILAVASILIVYYNYKISLNLFNLYSIQFAFNIDRLSAFFILLISIVSFCVAIYTTGYVKHYNKEIQQNILVGLMALFILAMILTVASKNMIVFLLFWEIMSITSLFLVMFENENQGTRKAGLFYFAMTQLSTLFLIIAFILVHETANTWDITQITSLGPNAALILILLLIGFGIKSGIIPFHKWLPYAHPASPSNISALMSGVMLKVAIYGFIRFLLLAPPLLPIGITLLVIGTITAILGIIYALKETDIKRMLAYSSIENIGIIFLGLGLFVIFGYYGLQSFAMISLLAALFHAFNHGLFKSVLFLTAGSVVYATETKDIDKLGGLIKNMPYTSIIFLIGAMCISALPPFNGFLSELLIFQSFLASGTIISPLIQLLLIICLSLFALTSAFAAFTFIKLYNGIFLGVSRSEHAKKAKEVNAFMLIAPTILIAICILLGLFAPQIFSILGYTVPLPNMIFLGGLLLIIALIVILGVHIFASKKQRITDTWSCEINSTNENTQYTAIGFSDPMITIFKPVYNSHKEIRLEYSDNHKTILKIGYVELSLMKIFEEYIYQPITDFIDRIATFITNMQNNNLDTYVIYVFITILGILIYLRWFN